MDLFFKGIEFIVNFIRQYVVRFIINKGLDWIWKKTKPILLKTSEIVNPILKSRLQKIRKMLKKLKQRKRTNARNTLALILIIVIMIIMIPKHMTIMIVISFK